MQTYINVDIITNTPVYAGYQKQQKRNLVKIPAYTKGKALVHVYDPEYNLEHYVVKLVINNVFYWTKLGKTTFDFLNE